MAKIDLSAPDGLSSDERCRRIEQEALPRNIGALFDQAVAECPDHPLWTFFEDGVTQTYAEAHREVLRSADALRRWGVTKGMAVAAMLPNIKEYPTLWLALARLGAVIVPVNIRYSQRELRYVVDTAQAERLLIDHTLVGLLDSGDAPPILPSGSIRVVGPAVLGCGSWSAALDEAEPLPTSTPVGLDDLVGIQFTSGTTGFPKGCRLTHRYWLTIGKVAATRDGRQYRRILASTPFTYMDPHWLLLMAIYQRGTLFVARRQSASRFVDWLHRYRIEFCLFPAAALKQPPSPIDSDNAIIRANVYGLRDQAHAEVERRFNLTAREGFGMTEIGSGMFVPIEAAEMVGSGSCGRVSPFRSTRIVDGEGHDVIEGEVGELLVRGPGLFEGYHRNPEATAAAFYGDWFRTGDLFRRDADGYHYIVGRLKDMVRRAGENIAAREVEAVIRDLPSVFDVAVLPVPDEMRGEEVKAYIVLNDRSLSHPDAVRDILAHCEGNLATFKVPRYLEFIDELPRTPSEKVAKGQLKALKPDQRLGAFDRVDGLWR